MNIPRASSITSLLLTAVFAVAACGSSASSGGPATPGASTGGGDMGGGGDQTPSISFANVGGGSCEVKITGDVTASWSEQQNMSSVLVTYWLDSADREMLDMAADDASFLINCQGDAGHLSLTSAGSPTTADFPEGPGTYVIAAAGILGGGESGQASVLLTIGDTTMWGVSEPGTLNVTALDGSKFAGNFEFKAREVGDDLQTVIANVTVSGSFDFGCSGTACG
jgi:hypothetical protein